MKPAERFANTFCRFCVHMGFGLHPVYTHRSAWQVFSRLSSEFREHICRCVRSGFTISITSDGGASEDPHQSKCLVNCFNSSPTISVMPFEGFPCVLKPPVNADLIGYNIGNIVTNHKTAFFCVDQSQGIEKCQDTTTRHHHHHHYQHQQSFRHYESLSTS